MTAVDDVRPLRGSALLLLGRVLGITANLVVQVLVVRGLSRTEYGAFAYALAAANLLTVCVSLGLEQAVQRFATLYDEQRRPGRLAGALVVNVVTVMVLGTVVVGAVFLLSDHLAGTLVRDQRAVSLLVVLALLAPLQALDSLAMNLFAIYARPTTIFWRRYVLGPALKIAVAVTVIGTDGSVEALAWGYVGASAVGLAVYGRVLVGLLRERGVLGGSAAALELPVRELFSFTVRAVSADLVVIFLFASDAIIVGALQGSDQVALLQAVQPLANGNLLVFYALIPLFIPQATRMFAGSDLVGLALAYRRSTLWVLVATFPVLALTVPLAGPLTTALFGSEYRSAGPILALLAMGQFLLAGFGLTGLTCKAFAELRLLVQANVLIAVLNVVVNIALVWRYGPLGAAAGTLGCIALLSALKCVAFQRATGLAAVDRVLVRGLLSVAVVAGAIAGLTALAPPSAPVAVLWAGLGSAIVLAVNWHRLEVGEVFPELGRTRIAQRLNRGADTA